MARQGAGQREGLGRKWAAQGEPPWPAEARRRAERTRMRMRGGGFHASLNKIVTLK